MDAGTGMFFIFESEDRFIFGMPEMQFPLDFVWISADCVVADVTTDVPPPEPGQSLSQLPKYSPQVPVQFVLEINAGAIEAAGITTGDIVAFEGDLAGTYGC